MITMLGSSVLGGFMTIWGQSIKAKQDEQKIIHKKRGLKRVAKPDDISKIVKFLLSKDAEVFTGQLFIADYGFSIGR